MTESYLSRIGGLIRDARRHKALTQAELAVLLNTSQSAVARIEQGKQNLSLEMIARIGEKLDSEIVQVSSGVPQNLRITGGVKLSGEIDVRTSKNAAVALLCASLLNKGRTTLRNLARIEEAKRRDHRVPGLVPRRDDTLALRELRTYRRITGRDDQLPLMADCERGLGRPEREPVECRRRP